MTGGMIERKPRTEQFFFADFFTLALVIYGYRYINKFVQQCEKDGFMTPDTLARYKRLVSSIPLSRAERRQIKRKNR